jgi:hypothetical protein
MYRLFMLCLTAAALSAFAVAQPQENENRSGNVPQHLGLETVIGCLSKGPAGTYNLTGGRGPREFRIISGETPAMQHWTGQDVEVLGIVGVGQANQPPYNSGSTTGVRLWTIKAQKVKELGTQCSMTGQEWPGDRFDRK